MYAIILLSFLFGSPYADPIAEAVRILVMVVLGLIIFFTGIDTATVVWRRRILLMEIKNLTDNQSLIASEATHRPSYSLIDSTDREILDCLFQTGGDIVKTEDILDTEVLVHERDDLKRRIIKMAHLGLLYLPKDETRLFLSPRGLDALNTPAPLFTSKIPHTLWDHVLTYKTALWNGDWNQVSVVLSQILELMLIELITPKSLLDPEKWNKLKEQKYQNRDIGRLTIGELQGVARDYEILSQGTFEDWLVGQLNALRKKTQHKKKGETKVESFDEEDAGLTDLYLEILLKRLF